MLATTVKKRLWDAVMQRINCNATVAWKGTALLSKMRRCMSLFPSPTQTMEWRAGELASEAEFACDCLFGVCEKAPNAQTFPKDFCLSL